MPSPHSSSSHSSSSSSGSSSSGSSWGSSGSSWGSSHSSWDSSDDSSWFDSSSRSSRPSDGFMGKYNQGEPWDPDVGDRRLGATNEDTAGLWGLGARAAVLNRERASGNPDLDADRYRSDDWSASEVGGSGNRRKVWIVGGLVLLAVVLVVFLVRRNPGYQDPGGEVVVTNAAGRVLTNPELFGKTLYLKRGTSGGYRFTTDSAYVKKLTWDSAEESYYDDESGLWLWFNTNVEPPLWQYWYEPISGDYGNYGWMEYENGRWYIETRAGSWSLVPQKYDTSALWFVETDVKTSGNGGAVQVVTVADSEEDPKTDREDPTEPAPAIIDDDSEEDLKMDREDTDEDLP